MPDGSGTPGSREPDGDGSSRPAPTGTTLYAEFTAKSGTESVVEELILAYADVVRSEPGNSRFEVYRRQEDPAKFVVFECYADEAAFRAHLSHPAGHAFNERLVPLIEEEQSVLSFLLPTEA